MLKHLGRLAVCASLLMAPAARAADPKVPPGNDPGGPAVAIISEGLDYTHPAIAARLARDGEGEIIGYDFADNDRFAFNAEGSGAQIAQALLADAPGARLALLRMTSGSVPMLAKSLAFVAQSPARIVLNTAPGATSSRAWALMQKFAPQIGAALFVIPAGDAGADLDQSEGFSVCADNCVLVTASDSAGVVLPTVNRGAKSVDVAVPAESATFAAARLAALAARIAEAEPNLSGAEMKKRILSLAAPQPGGATKSGWIADPARQP